jgi:chromosome segregation ATPase
VQRLVVAEHELLQMQVQLDEVRKENVIIKRTNTQLTGNLEDEKTHLVEIQLNLESSHTNDSSVERGGETEILKLKIEAMEVELEDLKNINEFNDEILHHKEDDLDKLAQKCEDLSQLISQLMTLLEFMNRELNELKITTEGFDRIVYVIHTFQLGRNKKRQDNGKNFCRRDCIRKFSYHRKFSYQEIFCSFMSEEIPQ